jgi:uncharacterized protein YbjT (DUF2867 family)
MKMYANIGVTGKVGGALARALLTEGQPVRAVVRDTAKGRVWAERGCEVAHAEMQDAVSLSAACKGAEGVFILPPSEFDPLPGFAEARTVIDVARVTIRCHPLSDSIITSSTGTQTRRR